MMNKHVWRDVIGKQLLPLAVVLALLLTACQGGAEPAGQDSAGTETPSGQTEGSGGEAGSKDTLIYGIGTAPAGVFQPILYKGDWDRDIVYMTYSRLLSVDESVNFVHDSDLAAGYEISDDSLEITFTLKSGIQWSDGQPFTAEDVAFTYTSLADPDYPDALENVVGKLVGGQDYRDGNADSVAGIEIIDENTIKFTYETVFAGALARFAEIPICAKHIWGDIPVGEWSNQTDMLANPVGTGPYKVGEYQSGQSVTLVPNELYFGTPAKIQQFIFKVINEDTAQASMISGEVDIVELTKLNSDDVQPYTDAGFQIITYDNSVIWWNSLNRKIEKLQDVRVRQAINHAIDKDAIVEQVLEGIAKVPTGPFPVSSPYSQGIKTYEYDPDKAIALLNEAGYEDTDGDGILEKDGEPLTLSYVYSSDNKIREQYALLTQQYLQRVGIDVIMLDMDFNSLVSEMFDHDSTRYEMGLMGASLRIDPSQGGDTVMQFSRTNLEDEYLRLQQEVDATLDQEVRGVAVAQWADYMAEESCTIFLYGLPRGFAAHPDLHIVSYMYEYTSHAHEWYFD